MKTSREHGETDRWRASAACASRPDAKFRDLKADGRVIGRRL